MMRATIRIPEDELVYEPGVLVVPHGGTIELELINDDKNTHCAVLPSNGDTQFIWLVNHSKGTATLELDGPGYYWYGSTTGNDEGRGLTGAIVVQRRRAARGPPRPPAPTATVIDPQLTVGKEHSMATEEYVDAGTAIPYATLSIVGRQGAAGGQGRQLRADPQRPRRTAQLAHLLRRLRRAALQPAGPDQRGERRQAQAGSGCSRPASMGLHSGASTYAFEASPLVVDGVMFVSGWDGWSGRSTRGTATSCGATSTRPRSTCRCAAATSTAGSPWPRGRSS